MNGNGSGNGSSNGKHWRSDSSPSDYEGALTTHKDGLAKRLWEGFKRDPNASITRPHALGADGKVFDVEAAAQRTADSPLSRKLKGRHLQMIAIGGSIGEKRPQRNSSWPIQGLTKSQVLVCLWDQAKHWQPVALPLFSSPFP